MRNDPQEQVTVLVADDEKDTRELFKEELEDAGFRVVLAQDGVEALSQVERGGIGAIVLDIKMPRMHGLAVLEELLAQESCIPIILSTAYHKMTEDCVVKAYPRLRCLVKPVRLKSLSAVVSEVVSDPEYGKVLT